MPQRRHRSGKLRLLARRRHVCRGPRACWAHVFLAARMPQTNVGIEKPLRCLGHPRPNHVCPCMTGVHAARCATTSNLVESTGTSVMTYTAVDGMGAKRFMAKTEETSTSILTLFGAHQVDVWGRAVSTSKPIALGVQGPVMVQRPFLVGGGIS